MSYGAVATNKSSSTYGHVSVSEPPNEWPAPKLTNQLVFENAMKSAEYKAAIPWPKTILLGILAGCYISIGALLAIVIAGGCPGLVGETPNEGYVGLQKLLFGLVFPVGLMLVTISGAELVTSSLALMPAAFIERRITFMDLLKNWVLSYFGNMAGCFFLCLIAVNSGIVSKDPWLTYLTAADTGLVWNKTHLGMTEIITRAFLCNWLVCLAVYNTNASNDILGKTIAIWPCIMAFAAMGFEHSIANMFILPLGWALGAEDVYGYDIFINNIFPVTLGNLLGAVFMLSISYSLAYGRTGTVVAAGFNHLIDNGCTKSKANSSPLLHD